jgi:anti-sigma B factor antagonist
VNDEIATVEVKRTEAACILRIAGELDLSNATHLEDRVRQEAEDCRALVLDLTALRFIDSSGVRMLDHLVTAYAGVRPVRVATTDPGPVRFTLKLCGFDDALLTTTTDAAVASLS